MNRTSEKYAKAKHVSQTGLFIKRNLINVPLIIRLVTAAVPGYHCVSSTSLFYKFSINTLIVEG